MTYKYLLIFLFVHSTCTLIKAQNLVPNPGFEPSPPNAFSWNNPSSTTPDYHTIEKPGWWHDYEPQLPHNGIAFMHLAFGPPNYEYVRSRLTRPLKKQRKYCISMYVSLMNKSTNTYIAIDRIGIALTRGKLHGKVSQLINRKKGTGSAGNGAFLANTEGWTEVCGIYEASGRERYLTIGAFGAPTYLDLMTGDTLRGNKNMNTSYFIDDVSLVEMDNDTSCRCQEEQAEIRSVAQEDTKPSIERITVENIYFDFDRATLLPSSYTELAQWIIFLDEHPSVHLVIEGYTDQTGDAEYNLALSEKRARAIYDHFIENGIVAERLSYIGYGSNFPLIEGGNKKEPEKNRRVSFRLERK